MPITWEYIHALDWSRSPVGDPSGWPRSLRQYVDLILGLSTPAIVFWGPELTQIYNDGYAVIMGPRHPRYYGGTYQECWPDTYPVIMPWMRRVLDEGQCVEVANTAITMTRNGFTEETFFSFTLSPLRDDDGRIVGVYQPVNEMTAEVLRARRSETLMALTSPRNIMRGAIAAFERNPHDLPFAGIYWWDESANRLVPPAESALATELKTAPFAPLGSLVERVFDTNVAVREIIPSTVAGPWPEPVRDVFAVPLRRTSQDAPIGVVVFGLSPRLQLDDSYREFLEAAARELGTTLIAQRADHAERALHERELASRREAAQLREEQARRMSALFVHAPVGIAVFRGPEHVFEVANAAYSALLPKRPLMNLPLLSALPELADQGIVQILDEVYRSGKPFVNRSMALNVQTSDGVIEPRDFDVVYQPIPAPDGQTDSIVAIVHEVTELARARRDAEAANRAKDEFFAILGHELRNPLAPITTALQLMKLRDDRVFTKERTVIERQVDHITRLVDDLLDVSRIAGGKVTLRRAPIELGDVIAKAAEMVSPLLEERRQELAIDVPAGLVLDGDPVRLAQVFANLLSNSAKYSDSGSRIEVTAQRHQESALIEVLDHGVGIAPEMLPRVFELFTQEKQSVDRARGGMGLGLAIVAGIVALHGGKVSAHSEGRGRGTRMVLELPLADAGKVQEKARPLAEPERATTPRRVLIVDDNRDAAEMIALALSAVGHHTRLAHDGAEALRVVDEFAPDVALLDLGLPVMDGYELAARLRARPGGDQLHLIAVTGYGLKSDRQQSQRAGFDAHLVKPVQLDAIVRLIEARR